MLRLFARSRPSRSRLSARVILPTLLLALACSACAERIALRTPQDALLTSCLIPLTGNLERDGPATERALEACDAKIAALRAYYASTDEKALATAAE